MRCLEETLKMPELAGRRGRWRRDTHLEVQVLKRRLLEEEEEMMEGIREGLRPATHAEVKG